VKLYALTKKKALRYHAALQSKKAVTAFLVKHLLLSFSWHSRHTLLCDKTSQMCVILEKNGSRLYSDCKNPEL